MRAFIKAINSRYILLLLLILLYSFRIVFLDADIKAPWGVLNYQPVDEGGYASMALSYQNFGTIDPNNYYGDEYHYEIAPHSINNAIGNFFTIVTMRIFGDNYWGLRLGTVIAGAVVVVFFYLFSCKLFEGRTSSFFPFFSSIVFSHCFVFYNASRIVEPTIFRMLFLQAILLIFVINISDKQKYFLIGLLTVLSVFLVYITNTFILFGLFVLWLFYILKKDYKKAKIFFLYNFIGGMVGYIISLIYYWGIWKTTPIMNAVHAVTDFSGESAYTTQVGHTFWGVAGKLIYAALAFVSSNMFLYFPWLLICFFIVFALRKNIPQKYQELCILSFGLICGLFFQTMVSEDYIVRKIVVLLPVFVFFVELVAVEGHELIRDSKIRLAISLFAGIEIVPLILVYRLYLITNNTNLDFTKKDKILLVVIVISTCVICYIFYKFFSDGEKEIKSVLLSGVAIVFFVNLLFVFKYDIYKLSYSSRDNMIALGDYTDNKVVCLAYENSVSLYNDMLPLVCKLDDINHYMSEDSEVMYYGYSTFENDHLEKDSINQNVDKIRTFEGTFKTFGEVRNWALYKYNRKYSPFYNKKCLFLGDSIVWGQSNREVSVSKYNYPAVFEKETGAIVTNGGIGGSCAAFVDDMDELNLDSLVHQIEKYNFKDYDYVFIAYGTNDLSYGVPIINDKNEYDIYSYLGAINYSIAYMMKSNPSISIILVTPLIDYRSNVEYGDALLKYGGEQGIPVINMYNMRLSAELFESIYWDKIMHPTDMTYKAMGEFIASYPNCIDTYVIRFCVDNETYIGQFFQLVTSGSKIEQLPIPYKAGYDFLGWYTNKGESVTGESYYNWKEDISLHARFKRR